MAYIYKHINPVTEKPFYIGIGKSPNYKRAHSKCNRNKIWHSIVNKYGYNVEILFDNLTWEEACLIEINLIKQIGRMDLRSGTLCNLTDGGEGSSGILFTDESRLKMSAAKKGKYCGFNSWNYGIKRTNSQKEKYSILRKGTVHSDYTKQKMAINKIGSKNPMSKIVLDMVTGIFYDCLIEAALSIDIPYKNLSRYLNGSRINKTNLIYV